MLREAKTAFILIVIMTCLTGLIYPLTVTLFAQIFFPWQANGSLLEIKGKPRGSLFIGQSFSSAKYFWSRPSATVPAPYNGGASMGSNYGPSNPQYLKTIRSRINSLNTNKSQRIPIDLITSSGSGLDPDISPYAAFYQVSRIASARSMSEATIYALIQSNIQTRTFYLLGEPRVNVLQLNMALDQLETT